ncbi:MAG: IPT/TIG domain-containing protein [Bryobacteraceae bacterium]
MAPVLLAVLMLSVCLHAQATMPQMKTVEPANGKAGDLLTVTGENLDKANVAKLYLTDGTHDIEVAMEEQVATSIKFKIPAKAKPGRLALMVLTRGKEPKLIEQPVKVTIDE